MTIAILLFEQFTALDVIGPYEILARHPDSKVKFVAVEKGAYKDSYGLTLYAEYALPEVTHADVLLIPGGLGIDVLLDNNEVLKWINEMHKVTSWTTSVCSGALLLAEAGILQGKRITTHWRRKEQIKKYNLVVEDQRYVHDGKIITAAGVSAGIDMALYLISIQINDQAAQMIQLAIEYDPQPPFNCGSPAKAPQELVNKLTKKKA
jgi:transcriptional regulator GlxA family with amidase domain